MHSVTRSPNYLCRNPYSYCFRIKVPSDLQTLIHKKELKYSLKTGNLTSAKSKARYLAAKVQKLFRDMRSRVFVEMSITGDQIQTMIKRFMERTIRDYDQPVIYNEHQDDVNAFFHYQDLTLQKEISDLESIKMDLFQDLNKGAYAGIEGEADKLLVEEGFGQEIDKSSQVYAKLCEGLIRSQIAGIGYQVDRLKGQFSDDTEETIQNCLPNSGGTKPPAPVVKELPQVFAHLGPKSPKISEVAIQFIDENKVKWTDKTKGEVSASIDLFIEVLGDLPIQSVKRPDIAEYKTTIKQLPPNKNKIKKYKGKSIQQLLEMSIDKKLSVERINKNLQRAGALFEYAILHGIYTGPNPATGMQIPKDKHASEKRAPYTNDELERLFRSEQYLNDSFSKHYMFWTPIIALFHGMRLNEIAGLFIEDVKQSEDGIWYFDDLYSRKSNPKKPH